MTAFRDIECSNIELHLPLAFFVGERPVLPDSAMMDEDGLQSAKKVLSLVMRLKTSKLLFNEPVDPVLLGLDDYFDKIKQPMDFGTIMGRLHEAESHGWRDSHYKQPAEVVRDVNLVFENALTYNDGEQDAVTRELAMDVRSNFMKRWAEAGLGLEDSQGTSPAAQIPPVDWQSEDDVPSTLSSHRGTMSRARTLRWLPCIVLISQVEVCFSRRTMAAPSCCLLV